MKTKTLTALLLILFLNCYAQKNKTCNTTEEVFEELNTISINKCNIKNTKKDANTRSIKTKNTRVSYHVRKGSKTNKKYSKSITKELLFTVVDEIPLFKKCTDSKNKECFSKEFYKHFSKNFTPEKASENGVKGRVFISFTILVNGTITKTLIKSNKNSSKLEQEIKRVIKKLPIFKTGIHKGLPVNVRYSLPINLTNN